jgi:Kelch motif
VPASFTVGGSVSGLASGVSLVLADNGTDRLTVTANGPFTFKSTITQNGAYSVTVAANPMLQTCTVKFGTGPGIAANVTTVAVACAHITKTWVSTADMSVGRAYFSAVPLADGTVLLAGGQIFYSTAGAAQTLLADTSASAQLYHPATGSWMSAGNMTTARQQYSATLLPNGSVLIAGGYSYVSPTPAMAPMSLATAEIFDPVGGTWTATRSMTVGRYGHTATLLSNGTVLVVGGDVSIVGGEPVGYSAEIYDPATATWTHTGSTSVGFYPTASALLPNGKVLVTGFLTNAIGEMAVAWSEIFDPSNGTWATTGANNGGQTATLLANGTVLVAGGGTGANSAEIYDPATDNWTLTGSMTTIRFNYTATLLGNGTLLAAGGMDDGTVFNVNSAGATAEIYDPANGTWAPTGNLNTSRIAPAAALLPDGTVLVAGGIGVGTFYDQTSVAGAEIYYP